MKIGIPTVGNNIMMPNQTEGAKQRSEKRSINGNINAPIMIEPLRRFVILLPNGEYFSLSKLIFIFILLIK